MKTFDLFLPVKVHPFGLKWVPAVPVLVEFPTEDAREKAMAAIPGSTIPRNPLAEE